MSTIRFTDCIDLVGSACKTFNGTRKYVSTGAVEIDHINESETEIVDYQGKPSRANLEVQAGDVLFAKMQGTKKTLLVDSKLARNIYSTGFCAVRPKKKALTERCLYHLLQSNTFLMQKDKHCSGATQKAITNAGLEKIMIKVPDIMGQEMIANKLDVITNIIANRQKELAVLDTFIKARFVELFGSSNQSWPTINVGDICTDTRTGPFGSALHHDEFIDDGIFVLGIDNAVENKFSYNRMRYITEEKYQQLKRYTVHPGDVIITIMGTIGRSAVIPDDIPLAINTKHLACLTPDYTRVNSIFLCSAFQMHPDVRRQLSGNAKGAIMDGLNLGIIKGLRFRLPPLQAQEDFVLLYAQVDKSKVVIQKALAKTQLLFDSLMQMYFG